jgi:hypothetical protein
VRRRLTVIETAVLGVFIMFVVAVLGLVWLDQAFDRFNSLP